MRIRRVEAAIAEPLSFSWPRMEIRPWRIRCAKATPCSSAAAVRVSRLSVTLQTRYNTSQQWDIKMECPVRHDLAKNGNITKLQLLVSRIQLQCNSAWSAFSVNESDKRIFFFFAATL